MPSPQQGSQATLNQSDNGGIRNEDLMVADLKKMASVSIELLMLGSCVLQLQRNVVARSECILRLSSKDNLNRCLDALRRSDTLLRKKPPHHCTTGNLSESIQPHQLQHMIGSWLEPKLQTGNSRYTSISSGTSWSFSKNTKMNFFLDSIQGFSRISK